VFQTPAKGNQVAGDFLMRLVLRRKNIFQLTHQGAFGNQYRPPEITRFDKAVVAGAVAKTEEYRDGYPQQTKGRHGQMDTQLFVPLIADDGDNRHQDVKQQAKMIFDSTEPCQSNRRRNQCCSGRMIIV
jgi:hypothetical protein